MRHDPYDLFARVYDAWQGIYSKPFAAAVYPYYEAEIVRRGFPEASLIDITCGTGTFLSLWSLRHPDWRLAGLDGSPGMLRRARANLAALRPRPLLRVARLESLPGLEALSVKGGFGAAVCMFDSLNHLTRRIDLQRSLAGVSKLLLPGGIFLFDMNDEIAFPRLFTGDWTVTGTGLVVRASARTSHSGKYGTVRFAVAAGRARHRETVFEIHERNWSRFEVDRAVVRAGLLVSRVRSIRPYPAREIEAPRTLWICRKGNPKPPAAVDSGRGIRPSRPSGLRRAWRRDILTTGDSLRDHHREEK